MELSKTTMKKLALLIAFAALCFTAFQWIDGATKALGFLYSILSPFLLGGAVLGALTAWIISRKPVSLYPTVLPPSR